MADIVAQKFQKEVTNLIQPLGKRDAIGAIFKFYPTVFELRVLVLHYPANRSSVRKSMSWQYKYSRQAMVCKSSTGALPVS